MSFPQFGTQSALLNSSFQAISEREEQEMQEKAQRTFIATQHALNAFPQGEERLLIEAVESIEERPGLNFDSKIFFLKAFHITDGIRKDIEKVLKVSRRMPEQIDLENNAGFREWLDKSPLNTFVLPTQSRVIEWQGDKKPRKAEVLLQDKAAGVPMAKLDLQELKTNSHLAGNVKRFFEAAIVTLRSAKDDANLLDLWGLENLSCAIGMDPLKTHNIMADPKSGEVWMVDTSQCTTFTHSQKPILSRSGINIVAMGCKIAHAFFRYMGGRERWINKLEKFVAQLSA